MERVIAAPTPVEGPPLASPSCGGAAVRPLVGESTAKGAAGGPGRRRWPRGCPQRGSRIHFLLPGWGSRNRPPVGHAFPGDGRGDNSPAATNSASRRLGFLVAKEVIQCITVTVPGGCADDGESTGLPLTQPMPAGSAASARATHRPATGSRDTCSHGCRPHPGAAVLVSRPTGFPAAPAMPPPSHGCSLALEKVLQDIFHG